jgi:hypothetical protein
MAKGRMLAVLMSAGLAFTLLQGGSAQATAIGNEGCTPGYWKQTQHFDSWQEYKPTETLYVFFQNKEIPPASVFDGTSPEIAAFGSLTAVQGLQLKGGPGVTGATEILLRASVAAFLNAATEELGYPYRRFNDNAFGIWTHVHDALVSGDRDQILALATTLDTANNLGCPLS